MLTGMIYFSSTDYKTTRKNCRVVGVEKALTVEPPEGNWELVSVCAAGDEIVYFWRRSMPTITVVEPQSGPTA